MTYSYSALNQSKQGSKSLQDNITLADSSPVRRSDLAGIPIQDLRGSRTAVYGASMSDDWSRMVSKDPDTVPRQNITGAAASLLPNRISWYFDLRGPSVHVDTACSSGMIALDQACQAMRSGDATAVCLSVFLSVCLSVSLALRLSDFFSGSRR